MCAYKLARARAHTHTHMLCGSLSRIGRNFTRRNLRERWGGRERERGGGGLIVCVCVHVDILRACVCTWTYCVRGHTLCVLCAQVYSGYVDQAVSAGSLWGFV
eukprot:Tamp_33957.p2 GENE.Tamp_33957~~Tamp_33957.p2  ORF type:complete len:103 (+),score=10.41 Tamp_33957:34-342(+)